VIIVVGQLFIKKKTLFGNASGSQLQSQHFVLIRTMYQVKKCIIDTRLAFNGHLGNTLATSTQVASHL